MRRIHVIATVAILTLAGDFPEQFEDVPLDGLMSDSIASSGRGYFAFRQMTSSLFRRSIRASTFPFAS